MSAESVSEFLATVELFSVFSDRERATIAEQTESRSYEFGETILTAGEPAAGLYVIKTGSVRLFTQQDNKETSLGVRKKGEVLAEIAAVHDYVLEYSARSSGKAELLFVPRAAITPLLPDNPEAEAFIARSAAISTAGGFVSQLFDLKKKVNPEELREFIGNLGIKRVRAGQTILEQDSRQDRRLYLIRQGTVSVVRRESDQEFNLATLQQGDVFGEKAAMLRQEQPATITAQTDTVLMVVPEQSLQFVFERNPKVREVLEERMQFTERELQRQRKLAERTAKRILLDLASKPRPGERIVKRFPLVEQAEEMDCGAACLAMICKHYGIPMTLGKLREMANVTTEGATLDSLARVGESLGFTTRGVQCTYGMLQGFELPFIAHWEGYHYIIVYGISKEHVWVADPAIGFKKMTAAEFERGWSGTCLLFTASTDLVQLAATRSPWVRFVSYLRPYKKLLLHLFLATLVIDLLGIAPPIITQNILDRVIVHENVSLLHILIIGLVITQVFAQFTTLLRGYLSNFMVRNLDFTMMSGFFKHAMSLPMSFFGTRRTGDVFARFQENQTIRNFLTESTISTLLNLMMVFIYFSVLFVYNVKLTLLLLVMVIPILILTIVVTPKLKAYARQEFETSTDGESLLMEILGGAETVKGMGIERPMRLRWEKKYAKALEVQYKSGNFSVMIGMIGQLMNATITVVILWVGASLVLSQELTIGQLVAFNALMGSVLSPLMGLVGLWDELHEAGVAMERLGDVLDLEPEQKPTDMASRIMLPDLRGDIRFDSVYFRYASQGSPYVLQNISFEIKAGEMVALVGQSGSGKTTLAKMLVGFYPPTEGQIYVDGYDLALIDREYYRSQIGYVMQSNLLFSGTIAENIAAGDENPDRRRIVEVAKMADAHAFIGNMPLGYEQIVGERGMGLSGGQMQRLCIARALYHDPRLLIFDEATSALDTQSESNILSNMSSILEGRTAVIIAHRLSTIMNADKILVLYDGRIIEQGTHQELVDKQGMYHQLVQKQMSSG